MKVSKKTVNNWGAILIATAIFMMAFGMDWVILRNDSFSKFIVTNAKCIIVSSSFIVIGSALLFLSRK